VVSAPRRGIGPAWLDEFCQHPYRVLFPIGVALSWGGVAHWALHAAGLLAEYRPRFHAIAQTQGFMTCLAFGFLFTMIPRRTGTLPPSRAQLLGAAALPSGVVIAAWWQQWALAQALWLVAALMLVHFVARRFNGPGEARTPNGFLWIPGALVLGIAGAAITLADSMGLAAGGMALVGQRMVQQGFFVALVMGVGGSLALPLMTRGQGSDSRPVTSRDYLARLAHLVALAGLAASFWLEVYWSLRLAMIIRAVVTLGVLVGEAQLWRRPTRPGINARLVWTTAWLLPAGYAIAALLPMSYRAGLHVSLIGGFALLGLSISAQVLLGHGHYPELIRGWPISAIVLASCMTLAIGARMLMEFDAVRSTFWMGAAATLFLAATLAWFRYTGPGIMRPRR
jgi:hypothetical protein